MIDCVSRRRERSGSSQVAVREITEGIRKGLRAVKRKYYRLLGDLETDIAIAIFQGFLSREADEEGIMAAKQILRDAGLKDGIRIISSAIFHSEENINRISALYAPKIGLGELREFSHVFSIGSRCATAQLMRQAGLRQSAGPFDWIFSSPDMVAHCIEDDFNTFLDHSNYLPRPFPEKQSCHHLFYDELIDQDVMFPHHDPSGSRDYSYMVRCVNRFREGIASTSGALLLCLTDGYADASDGIARLRSALCGVSDNNFVVVINTSPAAGEDLFGLKQVYSSADCHIYKYTSRSELGGISFFNQIDNLIISSLMREYHEHS